MTEQRINPSDETHEQVLSAAAFLRRALRFWRTALAVFVLGGVACGVFLFVRRPMFRSETVILYSEGVLLGDDADRPSTGRSVTARLKEILMSRASLDAVVREFDLYPEVRKTRGPIDAVEELRKHIEFRAPGGDTFTLAFTGSSPTEARAVTARLAEVVIGQDSDLRRRQAILVRDFLETENRATDDGLRDAELALASFMAAHPRFALDATPLATGAAIRASLGAGDVQPVSPPATAAPRWSSRPRRMAVAGTPSASNSSAEPAPSSAREAAAEEARAKAALAAARVNLADLAARFTAAHPDVRAAEAEVQRATIRLAGAAAAVASMESPSSTTGHGVQAGPSLPASTPGPSPVVEITNQRPTVSPPASAVVSPARVGELRGSEHDVVALETEWVKLTRGATEARQHQDQVEAALFKAKSSANSENGDHRVQVTVIDPAFSPQSAVPPGRTMIVALFAGVALLLAIAGSFLMALLDDRVFEGRDIAQFAQVLVEVPRRAYGSRR
jgi:uncharacterized protein involved in exopolysaccharide biosynthesis